VSRGTFLFWFFFVAFYLVDLIKAAITVFPLKLLMSLFPYSALLIFPFYAISYLVAKILSSRTDIRIYHLYPFMAIGFLRVSIHLRPIFANTLLPLLLLAALVGAFYWVAKRRKLPAGGEMALVVSAYILLTFGIQDRYFNYYVLILIIVLLSLPRIVKLGPAKAAAGVVFMVVLAGLGLNMQQPAGSLPETRSQNRGVILIVVDTARKDCLDIAKNGQNLPFLKEFLKDAVSIDKFIANGGWTPPTHASMFTGLLPSRHGVCHSLDTDKVTGADNLSDRFFTLAEILQSHGIATGGFYANPYLSGDFGFGQGFDSYEYIEEGRTPTSRVILSNYFRKFRKTLKKLIPDCDFGEDIYNSVALSDRVFSAAEKWLDRNAEKRGFFLFINIMEQHYIRYFHDAANKKMVVGPKYYHEAPEELYLNPAKMEDKNRALLEWHKRTIANVDYNLGRFVQALKARKLYESSTIMVTSDHGNSFGERDRYDHQDNIYDTDIFVPFFVKYAKPIRGRAISPSRVYQQVDMFSEILDIFNLQSPEETYGQAFVAARGNPPVSQLYRMNNIAPSLIKTLGKDLCGTILFLDGYYYQLIYSSSGDHEMFRLADFSTAEAENLYEKYKDVEEVRRFIDSGSDILRREVDSRHRETSDKIREKLRSLNYIQ
jgi:arylsulfatase A-like enzyme